MAISAIGELTASAFDPDNACWAGGCGCFVFYLASNGTAGSSSQIGACNSQSSANGNGLREVRARSHASSMVSRRSINLLDVLEVFQDLFRHTHQIAMRDAED